ncbi:MULTISPECIES: AAA family ATPase [Thiorhodovibrio]|uniref:AAA family ATPase n=1 Tax=Thiorhodovibrio TaxID=61593 RepID=UPI0019120FC2|nr:MULTISPECIES: AAA family ATPase [Thiorhodovibrio]MBK5970497.1 ATPase [Thiorhodovibrio winogradskyi]WPL12504.1 ATP-dependent zinc metalloprotease FtsH 3 [Thiorhodovibrio litoralis]
MTDLHDLDLILRSETPVLLIESLEEKRIIELFSRLAIQLGVPLFCWTMTDGLRRAEYAARPQADLAEPAEMLRHVKVSSQPGIYLLLDFHPFLDDPLHVRLIKEIALDFGEVARRMVLVSHALESPPEFRHLSARFSLRLPNRSRLLALIREEAQSWQHAGPRRAFRANRVAVDRLSRTLLGVTESDARRLIRNAIHRDGAITETDVEEITRAKAQLLSAEGSISFEYDTANFGEVAGLENLKAWIDLRRAPFLSDEPDAERPRGIMLLGVQGGGKSLAAKAVAGRFGVPLLRLDFGALYNKYIGETERNLRESLRTSEVMAPCVLWLDEIEKGLAGGSGDEGTGRRIIGTLLTWMAERKAPVFLVATSNDIKQLPPELVRKGRFDEIFFVDLPDTNVRREIFRIHLGKRGLNPDNFDLDQLAAMSEGFSGAGIEQAVVSALYAARSRDSSGVNTRAIAAELQRTQPLSVVMDEQIARLRAWARKRTVPA